MSVPVTPSTRTVVFGYHTMGCLGFDALLRHGFDITAVFTHRDDPHEEIFWESLADRAADRGIPVHFPAWEDLRSDGFRTLVGEYQPRFIFSFYFRWMLPNAVLSHAAGGAFNLHGSLLPRYRGRAPVNWVLVNGERETGVSLHHMVSKADAGDLVDQSAVPIAPEDTAFTLFGTLERAAITVLDRSLPSIRAGAAPSRAMDLTAGTYCGGRTPADGMIDWNWPAARIYNLIRAVTHPYPGAFTALRKARLMIWWAVPFDSSTGRPGEVLAIDRDGIVVGAGQGAVRLVTCQLAGQPELPACALAIATGLRVGEMMSAPGEKP